MENDQATLIEHITSARNFAVNAVSFDSKGDISSALSNYKEAITILEAEALTAPEENQEQMFELAKIYQQRVEFLEQANPKKEFQPKANFEWKEEQISEKVPNDCPENPLLCPFWVMRLLLRTIQHGGFITPEIYVPKAVWNYDGVKLSAITIKTVSCEIINDSLLKLKAINLEDTETLNKELENFTLQLVQIQNSLSKVLPSVREAKEEKRDKSIGHALKKVGDVVAKGVGRVRGIKKNEATLYLVILSEVFENSQFLGKWIEQYSKENSTITFKYLTRISDFFGSVVCSFTLTDLNELLLKYLKRARDFFEEK